MPKICCFHGNGTSNAAQLNVTLLFKDSITVVYQTVLV